MQKKHAFIALCDVGPEHAHFESPFVTNRARALGKALGKAGLGLVARIGSPVTTAVFQTLFDSGVHSVVLSPAVSLEEHVNAFRLPVTEYPTIFTGRGAIGADKMALASASALVVFGSQPQLFEGVIAYAKGHEIPIGVLTDDEPEHIHERVRSISPDAVKGLFTSHDPELLVRQLADELRRRQLSGK